jgi:hypothetical protein
MNPDACVGRTRLSAAVEVGVAFDFCVDLFIAGLDQDHHNLRSKAAGKSDAPHCLVIAGSGYFEVFSFPILVAVYQVRCVSADGVRQLLVFVGRLPVRAAATRRAPDIPNLAYRLLRFRREAFSAPVCDVLPERRRQKVSCHHRRRSNRRRSRGTNWPANNRNRIRAG